MKAFKRPGSCPCKILGRCQHFFSIAMKKKKEIEHGKFHIYIVDTKATKEIVFKID